MADPIMAWEEGWLAHHQRMPDTACPYPHEQHGLRHGWLLGWRDAQTVHHQNQQAHAMDLAPVS
jgi:ribosome modulation factor